MKLFLFLMDPHSVETYLLPFSLYVYLVYYHRNCLDVIFNYYIDAFDNNNFYDWNTYILGKMLLGLFFIQPARGPEGPARWER